MRFVASGEEIFKAYNSLVDSHLVFPYETMISMEGMTNDEWEMRVRGVVLPKSPPPGADLYDEVGSKIFADDVKKDAAKLIDDNVNHPSHYNDGKIEVIEFIEDKKLGFHLGNAVKYIARAGKKDPAKVLEDLRKAIWYINRHIELTFDQPRRPNDMQKEKLK